MSISSEIGKARYKISKFVATGRWGDDIEKTVANGGERQASPLLSGIRPDHLARYKHACKYMPDNARILDMACGCGYGSFLMSQENKCQEVTGIDISLDAIKYAEKYYSSSKTNFLEGNCFEIQLQQDYNFATCFETIEHIQNAELLLHRYYDALIPGSHMVLSTPNQNDLPYSKQRFPFHVRHYTPEEIINLVESVGFVVSSIHSQVDRKTTNVQQGNNGLYLILNIQKP